MNKQVDLISNGEAFGIAEDRGWQFGATHQRLTDLAREGRLRVWGYKGNSAELCLIDKFVWQNHGLDPSNGQLVIPGKIFARDYAEQVFRDIHFDRQEIEAAFPPDPLVQIGSDPANPDPSETGEVGCFKWLAQQMRESPTGRQMAKGIYEAEAKQRFGVSIRGFRRQWDRAIEETKCEAWKNPGRPKGKS
jgi:hypothetical protein